MRKERDTRLYRFEFLQDGAALNQAKRASFMASELERAIVEMHTGTVTVVNLEVQEIGDAGATQLADALSTCNISVEQLHLLDNSISAAGATQLADALRTNTSVKKLDLSNNAIEIGRAHV